MARVNPASNGKGELSPKLRYILYTRVSSAAQEDNNSHESQLAALQKHVAAHDGLIVGVHRETASGGSYLGRPGIRSALDSMEKDEADVLLCFDFSRYSRDEEHQQAMMRRIERLGKRIEFTNLELQRDEFGELTPESRLMFGVSGSFVAYHRAKIRADTMRGRLHAAKKGVQSQRKAPLGYRIVRKTDIAAKLYPPEALGKYFVIEELRPMVEQMFQMRARGESFKKIRDFMADKGVTSYGKPVTDGSISRMIANPVYRGVATFGRMRSLNDESRLEQGFIHSTYFRARPSSEVILIPVPAIVSEDLWQRANSLKVIRGALGEHRGRWLLSSVLRCPRCGGSMNGHWHPNGGQRTAVYLCRAGASPYKETRTCLGRAYDARTADERVLAVVRRLYEDEAFLTALLGQDKKPDNSSELGRLNADIERIQKQEELLIEAQLRAINAGADSRVYETRLASLSAERRQLVQRVETLKPVNKSPRDKKAIRAQIEALENLLTPEALIPSSSELNRVHLFLLTTFERIEFDEVRVPTGKFPRWQVGTLRFTLR